MPRLTFLGTGDFLAPKRWWNSFVIDGRILVETSPSALPMMRHCDVAPGSIEVVVVSHFHPDHTFGYPFLLLEWLHNRDGPLTVVGPTGVEDYFYRMLVLGSLADMWDEIPTRLDLRWLEVDGEWQEIAGCLIRAVEVEHVPNLECFGFLIDTGDGILAYSGDTHWCEGLRVLAENADTMVVEFQGRHEHPAHLGIDGLRTLRQEFADLPLILTHLSDDTDVDGLEGITIAKDGATYDV